MYYLIIPFIGLGIGLIIGVGLGLISRTKPINDGQDLSKK